MTDLASQKAKAEAILDKLTSTAYHYEIEIDEAEKIFQVVRVCELMDDEAENMGLPPQDDYQVILKAASEAELYQKIINM
jgi:predicted patatin/cPLA2 family phospholipase